MAFTPRYLLTEPPADAQDKYQDFVPPPRIPQNRQPAAMTASNTAFTVFSRIGFILSAVPLWWHRNFATLTFIAWTALDCLIYFVDSIVWSGNTVNRAPVRCDICAFTPICLVPSELYPAVRIELAAACVLCAIRYLYKIATGTTVTDTVPRYNYNACFVLK